MEGIYEDSLGSDGTIYFSTLDGRFMALSTLGQLIVEVNVLSGSYAINNSSPLNYDLGKINIAVLTSSKKRLIGKNTQGL